MPTQQQIADHWGVTQARVAQLVKDGCPTNSLKAADRWREARGKKRVKTNPDTSSANLRTKRGRPLKPVKPSKTGDSLLDALNNTIIVSEAAFRAYQYAVCNNWPTQSVRLSEHSKAIDARMKTEKTYREELERRNLLVLRSDITDRCRKAIDVIVNRLRRIPAELGPQVNEREPIKAVTVLQRSVDEILLAAQKALHDL